jgi:hypothetical protein
MSKIGEHGWAGLVRSYGVPEATAERLIRSLTASGVAALAFCRLLDRWARGEPEPSTPGGRQAALRHVADGADAALTALELPLERYLLELEPERAEGRSWYGEPGAAELVEWEPVLRRAGVRTSPIRVARAYLELAVLVRALEGLTAAATMRTSPDRSSLWAGLFDLRENLLDGTLDDLRVLAVT